jgi:hypothetical protein
VDFLLSRFRRNAKKHAVKIHLGFGVTAGAAIAQACLVNEADAGSRFSDCGPTATSGGFRSAGKVPTLAGRASLFEDLPSAVGV